MFALVTNSQTPSPLIGERNLWKTPKIKACNGDTRVQTKKIDACHGETLVKT